MRLLLACWDVPGAASCFSSTFCLISAHEVASTQSELPVRTKDQNHQQTLISHGMGF